MKLTVIQKTTIIALIAYVIWEIVVMKWEENLPPSDPVIRADLIIIIPVLSILIIISLFQFFIKKK